MRRRKPGKYADGEPCPVCGAVTRGVIEAQPGRVPEKLRPLEASQA